MNTQEKLRRLGDLTAQHAADSYEKMADEHKADADFGRYGGLCKNWIGHTVETTKGKP